MLERSILPTEDPPSGRLMLALLFFLAFSR